MSQYIYFYVKHPDSEKFIMIDGYSRGSYIYQVAVQSITVPVESLRPLTNLNLTSIFAHIKHDIEVKEKRIAQIDKCIDFLSRTQVQLQELLDTYEKLQSEKEEAKQDIEDYTFALHFYNTLLNILSSNTENKDSPPVLYFGIECYNPTIDDIAEL